jgi:TnpA family transposase
MARRRLLSDELLAPFWAWASDERTIVRHYTLSLTDLDLIAKKRTASNRLGFAVLMCGMRFPGRVLDVAETPPTAVLAFIADQVGVTPAQFATYRLRPTNRREHIAELMANLGCRAFDTRPSGAVRRRRSNPPMICRRSCARSLAPARPRSARARTAMILSSPSSGR